MLNRNSQTAHRKPDGFTLVELLLVIGIIAVLMSLLIPAVTKVRIAGQKVATQALINRLTAACEAYFQDFNAYPGPFTDDQVVNSTMTLPTEAPYMPYKGAPGDVQLGLAASPATPMDHAPTSSENLFLGLCGGLRYNVATFVFDSDLAKRGLGPAGLNPATTKRPQSYFPLNAGDISASEESANPLNTTTNGLTPGPPKYGQWWVAGNGYTLKAGFLGDSEIPEFVDTFKVRRPILYMRAQRGVTRTGASVTNVTGFLFDPANPAVGASTPYQYDPSQIKNAYSNMGQRPEARYVAGGSSTLDLTGDVWKVDILDYPAVRNETNTKDKFIAGTERYFVNEQLSTGNPTAAGLNDQTKVLIPQQRDKFILISAGPDGLYGTADDIRN